jgi:hypothetical protein
MEYANNNKSFILIVSKIVSIIWLIIVKLIIFSCKDMYLDNNGTLTIIAMALKGFIYVGFEVS